jgi:hypothetical protein
LFYPPTKESILIKHWVISACVTIGIFNVKTDNKVNEVVKPTDVKEVVIPSGKPDRLDVSVKSPTTLKKDKSCPQFEHVFREYQLPVKAFSYIAYRESRCNPKAINAIWENGKIVWTLNKNGSYDSGLLQINSSWKTVTRNICGTSIEGLLTLDCNLSVAKYLYENGGLRHWSM